MHPCAPSSHSEYRASTRALPLVSSHQRAYFYPASLPKPPTLLTLEPPPHMPLNHLFTFAQIDSGRVRMGLLLFSDDAMPQFDLDEFNSRADVMGFISDLAYPRGRTNTADAIR